MSFNLKETVEKIVDKAKNDSSFMDKLKADPEKAIESLVGFDIPSGSVSAIVSEVKAKLSLDKLSGVMGLFKK